MTIRKATQNDLTDIVAIYNETIPGRMVTADTEEVSVADAQPAVIFAQFAPDARAQAQLGFRTSVRVRWR